MIRGLLLLTLLSPTIPLLAQEHHESPALPDSKPAHVEVPASTPEPEPVPASPLPPMRFISSIAEDELLATLKSEPALAELDPNLAGSPLALIVTHTLRPTSGGQAAGFVSAVLSGSTLGLIPIVSNERLVLKYEILLNGKSITSHSFERTATRAQNLWTAGNDGYNGLGKAGMEWALATAAEAAATLAADPKLRAVQEEIEFYFPASAPRGGTSPADSP